MMERFLKRHLKQDFIFNLENTISEMQVMLLHRGVLHPTEVYDIIFVNGVKVIIGTHISTSKYTDFSPKNPKELFNLRHSSLRNAIERIFDVLKKRFQILTQQVNYSYKTQVRLVNVLCCIHNIIRIIGGDDDIDKEWIRELNEHQRRLSKITLNEDVVVSKAITGAQTKQANAMRDQMAAKMWAQYTSIKR